MKKILLSLSLLLFSGIAGLFISYGSVNKTNNQTPDPNAVVINGVQWAKCNIDKPGTFAAAPEKSGMFYQWNNNIGWSATNPIVSSNGSKKWPDYNPNCSTKDGYMITKWSTANDPSPKGWRLPTIDEYRTLLDTEKVSSEWTKQNGVNGRKFTDKKTGQSIFFPAAGHRVDTSVEIEEDTKKLYEVGENGYYWNSGSSELDNECIMNFSRGRASLDPTLGFLVNNGGLSIRCVKE